MSLEKELFLGGGKLVSPDGRLWIGDESNGFWEDQLTKKPESKVSSVLEEHQAHFRLYGGGKPNLE